MKDSKKYSPKVTKLFRALKKDGDVQEMPSYKDPLDAVVFALVGELMDEAVAVRTVRRMEKHFVDKNDLRVSRKEEILDVFKDHSEDAEKSARAMTKTLNTIFEKYDKVSLKFLREEGKRQARKELEEIEGITPFAASYCFLTALDGHAIPLNSKMLEYLRANQLVHPDATDHDIAGFLERQIGAADAYAFYVLLRHEAETAKPVTPKKAVKKTAKKKTATKKKTAAKKTTAKKKTAKKKTTATKKKTAAKKKTTKKKTVKKKK